MEILDLLETSNQIISWNRRSMDTSAKDHSFRMLRSEYARDSNRQEIMITESIYDTTCTELET